MWFEVAIIASIFALGNILLGHFEEGTPKWRRVVKFFVFVAMAVFTSKTLGRPWFFLLLGTMFLVVAIIHVWLLLRCGINPLTAEPRDKYYELRGWKVERGS